MHNSTATTTTTTTTTTPNATGKTPADKPKRKSILAADMGLHNWSSSSPNGRIRSSTLKRMADDLPYGQENDSSVWHHATQSRREQLMDFLTTNGIDRVLDWMQAIFSLVAVVIYVVQTYIENLWLEPSLLTIEIIIGIFFMCDYILGLYLAKKRCSYIWSLESLVDFVTIVPLFIDLIIFFNIQEREKYRIANMNSTMSSPSASMSSITNSNAMQPGGVTRSDGLTPFNFAVFRVTRVLRALRVLRAWKAVKFGTLGISINAFKTIFTIVTLVFCGSGIFIALEHEQNIKFHQAIYFMFITITTIGYGDFKPLTPAGQMFVVLFMSFTFVVIPKQIAKLRLHSRKNRLAHVYENPLTANGHLLLCGHMTPGALIDFVHELYDTR
jgi:hypothetical protein